MCRRAETDGKIGRSRGGLTSKIHAVTNGSGKPMKIIITAGTVNDSTKAIELLKNIIRKGIRVLADKGYDSAKILAYIQYCYAIACIPPRKNKTYPQKYYKEVYKNRNQIERFFQRLKNFRRVATRYDKLPSSFLSFVHIAAVSIIIPKFGLIV
jgi:transposase